MGSSSVAFPAPPAPLRRKNWGMRILGRLCLRLSGWRVEGAFPETAKCVTIVAPHTSNWDFLLGLAVKFALEVRVSWLGKHTIFRAPFKRFLRWMGGIPVDRSASHGVVGACVEAFSGLPSLMLALAPEGTRKGVSQWRSGFYQIAVGAGVAIFPVALDYRRRVVALLPPFTPTGDFGGDLERLQALFRAVPGKRVRPEAAG